ncbi:MAG: proteasome assembly chaperone family protein [Euryarchaeota archaeon]|nr:proteasome assembly chaperone family protein [Euryarchaeota archaeon]
MSESVTPARPARERRGREKAHPFTGESFAVVTWEPLDLKQALVVIGFPSVGLVGTIATAHLATSLKLREVGAVVSPSLPPTAVVHEGVSRSPIRIYLGNLVCGPEGDCQQLCVVHSDVAPKPSSVTSLAFALVAWAKEQGARGLVCLEGLNAEGAPAEDIPIFGVAGDEDGRELLGKLGVQPLQDGLLTGVGGVALYAARALGLRALCFVAESRADLPDARGAARLLERLQPVVPLVLIDERPLYEAARTFEAEFRKQAEKSKRSNADLARHADLMYG